MGKPMGNGLPLAGCIASAELVNAFRRGTQYFNTFASSPLQAAVGMAVLDVIEDEGLIERSSAVGAALKAELRALQARCPNMGDVRGRGLFIGIDWVSDREAKTPDANGAEAFVNEMKRRGMLIGRAGEHGNVLKVRPPLVFEKEHGELFLAAFRDAIAAHAGP
jgi:4-aminobutyrate aminotransferase-like enzyme